MDALKLLKEDHDRIKPLLAELKETTDRAEKTRGDLFSRIKEELTIHEIIEEEIFYPTLKEHPNTHAADKLHFDAGAAAYKMKDYGKALQSFSQALRRAGARCRRSDAPARQRSSAWASAPAASTRAAAAPA